MNSPFLAAGLRLPVLALLLFSSAQLLAEGGLVPGESVTASLDAEGKSGHELELESGWFVSGRVDPEDVELAVRVLDPAGEQKARFHVPDSRSVPVVFSFTTESAGTHRLEVEAVDESAGPASFRIRLLRSEPEADEPAARLDQLLSVYGDDMPGVVAAVVRNGELAHVAAAGMADLANDRPIDANTISNIGSTAKQFMGFALALLDHRGDLGLDDDVRDYLPELPDFGETVTLRHLLTHTSGYREIYNTLALAGRRFLEGDAVLPGEYLEVIQRQPALQNVPGAEWNYNNTGYGLLVMVVEKVTETPFEDWMRAEVFEPLGMMDTGYRRHPGQPIPGASIGYLAGQRGYLAAPVLGSSMGAGGLYTTVGDMARWMGHLGRFELGGPEVREALVTPFVLNNGEASQYGLGLFIDEFRGLVRWQHGGGDIAHRSWFHYFPELDAGYLVFSNDAGFPGRVSAEIARTFFADELEDEAPEGPADESGELVAFDPASFRAEDFDRFTGRYELEIAPGFVLRFFREDEQLKSQATGQPSVDLEPVAPNRFRIVQVDAQIEFHVEEDGSVPALTLFQNGEHRAVRLEDEGDNGPDLGEYAGRYFSAELEVFYDLEVKDDQLVVRQRRLDPVTLTHVKDDRFSATFPIAELAFTRDGEAQVDGFTVGNVRARDIRFDRVE